MCRPRRPKGSGANCALNLARVLAVRSPAAVEQLALLATFVAAAAVNVAMAPRLFGSSKGGGGGGGGAKSADLGCEGFLAPLIVTTAAAFGDCARRLLVQRVGVQPDASRVVPATVLLLVLAVVADPARRAAVAAAAAVLWFLGAARSARAIANALDIAIWTIRSPAAVAAAAVAAAAEMKPGDAAALPTSTV